MVSLLSCVLYAAYFATLRMSRDMWDPAAFARMVDGSAMAPFQFRALIPWSVSLVRDFVGEGAFNLEHARMGSELLFVFLLLVVFRAYMVHLLGDGRKGILATLALAMVLPFHYIIPEAFPFYYVYDLPSVFFFTLGLLLLHKRQWLLYYPLFALATFNRESTCFLTLIYVLTCFRREWRSPGALAHSEYWKLNTECSALSPLLHVLAQSAIWISIKALLNHLYPGDVSFNHFTRNFYMLRLPSTYPILFSVFGYTWLLALFGNRLIKDDFVRRACYAVPLFFAVIFVVGQIRELPLYGEMIPVVVPAAILAGQALCRRNAHTGKTI